MHEHVRITAATTDPSQNPLLFGPLSIFKRTVRPNYMIFFQKTTGRVIMCVKQHIICDIKINNNFDRKDLLKLERGRKNSVI